MFKAVSNVVESSRLCNQIAAPLPELPVEPSDPFSVVGVDYAGPVFRADQHIEKLYILLFTCAAIRTLHIELTDSLNVEDYKLAFRRFAGRRDIPSLIISDNEKTFQSMSQEITKMYCHYSLIWQFIVL